MEGPKGGRDVQFFESVVDDEFICPICLQVLVNPKDTPCSHTFCGSCIQEQLKSKNQCPTCRNVVETKDLKTTIVALRNILLKLITFCDNKPNGCAWKAEWSKLEPHLNNCDFSKVSCSFNCGESFLQKEKDEHEAKCNQRPQQCEHCSVNLKACNFPGHYETECPKIQVECIQCKSSMRRESLQSHLEKKCPDSKIECPFAKYGCKEQIKRKDLKSHLDVASNHMLLLLQVIGNLEAEISKLKVLHTPQPKDTTTETIETPSQKELMANKGILYSIGCKEEKSSWKNPVNTGEIAIKISEGKTTSVADFVERKAVRCYLTSSKTPAYFTIDFKKRLVKCSHFSLANGDPERPTLHECPWELSGSADETNWVRLYGEKNLNFDINERKVWRVDAKKFYRFFRVSLSSNGFVMWITGFEIFGELK